MGTAKKKLVFGALGILFLAVGGLFYSSSRQALAESSGSCFKDYGIKQNISWNYQNFRFDVFEFRLSGTDTNPPGYIDSRQSQCLSGLGGGDKVTIDDVPGLILPDGRRPVGVELGVPRHPVTMGNYNNGEWQGFTQGQLTPINRPAIFTQSFGRSAAAVDDSGRFVIGNSNNSQQRQVFCIHQVTSVVPSGAFNCPEDIKPNKKGAGVLLRADNCVSSTDLGGTVDNGSDIPFNCINDQSTINRWFQQGSSSGVFGGVGDGYSSPTDLTNFIGRNGSNELNDFYVHLDATNTQPGGFSVAVYMTFRYPLTGGGDYNNQATLSRCAGQGTVVNAGDTICLVPGINNIGGAYENTTWIELDSDNPGFLSPVSQSNGSDPYYAGGGYNAGCMANGQCENHYYWYRTRSPAYGTSAWSVQYQPTRLRINPATPIGTTICFRTHVTRATPSANFHTSGQECFGVGTTASTPCPSLPNPQQAVSLPDVSPNSPAVPFLPFTTVRDDTYYQDVRQNRTNVVSINDESSGGNRTPPTLTSQTYQAAVINYSPYVSAYPFDNNRPSVTYDSYYDRTTWRSASSPSFYACPDGWGLVNGTGPTCESWYPANQYYTCPSGWSGPTLTGYGWLCSRQNSYGAVPQYSTTWVCYWPNNGPYATGFGYLCKNSRGQWVGPATPVTYVSGYSCPYGGNLSGSTCYYTDWTPANGPYYSCPYGGTATLTGYGWLCRRTQQGTALYNWRTLPVQRNQTTRNTQYNTPPMSPCWNRTYDAYPQAGTATLTPDPESPNQSSFTGQISVNFGTAQAGAGQDPMRVGSRINNLPYTIDYTILRASGGSGGGGQVNGTVNLAASNNNRNASDSTSVSHSISVSVPGNMQVGDRVCWTIYTTSAGGGSRTFGHMDVNGNYVNGTGSGQRSSQSCSPIVINAPYMRVYGGDILAGSGFGVGCSVNNSASIIGWNRGNGAGSAVQFAAQAAGLITDFASAAGRGASPTPPRGLSFANTSGTYGGNFGTGHCARDYFANATNVQNGYTSTGATITPGSRQKIYVEGDAFIRGNIIYTGNGNWGNLSQVPSFYLIARGNIYISEQVTQLDGVYVAQPAANGTGGRIYTCVDHNTRLVMSAAPDAYNRCQNQLVVNGSFLAKQIRFLRSRGSLRDSSPNEASTSGTIAEVFNYSPELFIVDPELSPAPARQYESATGLPPVL